MHLLEQVMRKTIASGLRRTSIKSCAKWATEYRMMKTPGMAGKWTFDFHPWLYEMHLTKAYKNIGMKSAQVGYTEWAMNMTFYKMDILNTDCLYVLPTDSDASDFSSGRFAPALEMSKHLQDMFSDTNNVGHKRAGSNSLYIRGSRSRSKLKSIPTGFIVLDELDEMEQKNLALALERASGQLEKQVLMISTPTIPEMGIDREYQDSTQEHFVFKCPSCSRHTELIYPESIVITAEHYNDPGIKNTYLICKECKATLDHDAKPEWLKSRHAGGTSTFVPSFKRRDDRGFHVNQLYSFVVRPHELASLAIRAETDPTDETEFHNSKLGMAHVVKGARLDDATIDSCKGNFLNGSESRSNLVTMGVDVGSYCHVAINEWTLPKNPTTGVDINVEAKARTILVTKISDMGPGGELDELMRKYRVRACVIDNQPETRMAYDFATRFWGHILLCIYGRGLNQRQVILGNEEEKTITVNRTSWLDLTLGRFKNRMTTVPKDIPLEFYKNLKALVRVYEKDSQGNAVGRYVDNGADHFAHALNYAEIALPLAMNMGVSHNISGVY